MRTVGWSGEHVLLPAFFGVVVASAAERGGARFAHRLQVAGRAAELFKKRQ